MVIIKGARGTQHLSVDTIFYETDSGKINTKYEFQPSVGNHYMWYVKFSRLIQNDFRIYYLIRYEGTLVWIERTREQRMMEPWETIQLQTYGNRRKLFAEILDEAREMVNHT